VGVDGPLRELPLHLEERPEIGNHFRVQPDTSLAASPATQQTRVQIPAAAPMNSLEWTFFNDIHV
jgi:hypothetical protein